jgi:hypothetical protein
MKSIRLSLVLCFLLLLGLALGTVSWFVYRTTKESLLDKERAAQKFFQEQFKIESQAAREVVDEHILQRAQTLARMAQTQWGVNAPPAFNLAGFMGIGPSPLAGVTLPAWLDAAERRRRAPLITIDFAEDVLEENTDGVDREFFQTCDYFGKPLQRSTSMGTHSFVLNSELHEQLALFEWHFDDATLPRGQAKLQQQWSPPDEP